MRCVPLWQSLPRRRFPRSSETRGTKISSYFGHRGKVPRQEQVCGIVKAAYAAGGKVRVRGSEHSDPESVYTTGFNPRDGPPPSAEMTNVILDKLQGFSMRGAEIEVQAGLHLGGDPFAHSLAR